MSEFISELLTSIPDIEFDEKLDCKALAKSLSLYTQGLAPVTATFTVVLCLAT